MPGKTRRRAEDGAIRKPRMSVLAWGLVVFLLCSAASVPVAMRLSEALEERARQAPR